MYLVVLCLKYYVFELLYCCVLLVILRMVFGTASLKIIPAAPPERVARCSPPTFDTSNCPVTTFCSCEKERHP